MKTNDNLGYSYTTCFYLKVQGTRILLCVAPHFCTCMKFAWLSRAMNRFGLGSSASFFTRRNYRWYVSQVGSMIATIGTFGKGFVSMIFMDIYAVWLFGCSSRPHSTLIKWLNTRSGRDGTLFVR
jgi:hypothetical protein